MAIEYKKPDPESKRLVDIKFYYNDNTGHEAVMVTQIGKLLNIPGQEKLAIIHSLLLSGKN